jgi:hypothetical protein
MSSHNAWDGIQNAELFTLTYGALVVQLIKDYEDYSEVNRQLEKMSVFSVLMRQVRGVQLLLMRF